jgi:hypothetical protein
MWGTPRAGEELVARRTNVEVVGADCNPEEVTIEKKFCRLRIRFEQDDSKARQYCNGEQNRAAWEVLRFRR